MMPMNRANYPAGWKQISERIRERDGQHCRHCGVPNRAIGCRDADGTWYGLDDARAAGIVAPVIRIVLTVAHLDHDTTNNSDDNLVSLCQMCHNRYDAPHRAVNATKTRARNARKAAVAAGQMTMFESEE
jgi:5-methylcytosine-specific restriction endonuclease McrA